MSRPPSFCAVLPNYNHAGPLERSLKSLTSQTSPLDRIIVINDGSTDGSLEVLKRSSAEVPALTVINNGRNLGIMASVNIGLEAASEDFVFLVSATDHYASQAVEQARKAAAISSDIGLIAGKVRLENSTTGWIREFEAPLAPVTACYDAERYVSLVRRRNFSFYGGGVFVHRKRALAAGGFRQELKWHADWFLFSLLASRHGFAYVPEVFGFLEVSEGQYSQGMFDWTKQSILIDDYLALLKREYPEDYRCFRSMALFPSYDIEALSCFYTGRYPRDFLTPLLLWRLSGYKVARVIGRLMPYRLRERLRALIRL